MFVRLTTQADIARLDRLFAESYAVLLRPDYEAATLDAALPLMARAQPELVTSGSYYAVEEDGAILGAGGWTHAAPGSGALQDGLAHIRHVVTDHRAVRRGVGRMLLRHVFAQARQAGATRLGCISTRTAVPFYTAMGFRAVGAVSVPIAPGGFPAVEMARDL